MLLAYERYRSQRDIKYLNKILSAPKLNSTDFQLIQLLSRGIILDDPILVREILAAGVNPKSEDDLGHSQYRLARLHNSARALDVLKMWPQEQMQSKGNDAVATDLSSGMEGLAIHGRIEPIAISQDIGDESGKTQDPEMEAQTTDAQPNTQSGPSVNSTDIRFSVFDCATLSQYLSSSGNLRTCNPDISPELVMPVCECETGQAHVMVRTRECVPNDADGYYWELQIVHHADQDT